MTWVLLQKELSRNWRTFLILGALTCLAVWTAVIQANAYGTGAGAFAGVGSGLFKIMLVAGLMLGHVLIATEYQGKTQLFLEGLPLPKWRMITMKLILGLGLACLYATGSVFIGWLAARGSEVVTANFLGILISSACGWAMFVTGFFLVTGFLGRYRIIIFATILVTILILFNTNVPVKDFPPYALIDSSRFGLERDLWPAHNLKITGAMIAGWILAAYILGLAKEGSLSSMLGEKMSYREKMFIGGAFGIGVLMLSNYIFTPKKGEAFSVPGAIVEEWEGVEVAISPEELDNPIDLEVSIASKLARRLAKQRDWLEIPKDEFPKIFVVEKSDIEEVERIDSEDVADQNVVLMYAGYRQKEYSDNRLLSWTLSYVLRKYSLGRVTQEDRWWIVCGLEGLWELEEATPELLAEREQMAVEAVKKHGLTIENLMDWSKYQEDAEWRSADAVAWMGMRKLVAEKGKQAVLKFAQATVLERVTREDSRAVAWHYINPVTPAFKTATGLELEDFTNLWREYILSFETQETEDETK